MISFAPFRIAKDLDDKYPGNFTGFMPITIFFGPSGAERSAVAVRTNVRGVPTDGFKRLHPAWHKAYAQMATIVEKRKVVLSACSPLSQVCAWGGWNLDACP